jgi:nitrogenase molybdenum-iron protein alpha/beta subunit
MERAEELLRQSQAALTASEEAAQQPEPEGEDLRAIAREVDEADRALRAARDVATHAEEEAGRRRAEVSRIQHQLDDARAALATSEGAWADAAVVAAECQMVLTRLRVDEMRGQMELSDARYVREQAILGKRYLALDLAAQAVTVKLEALRLPQS